MRLFSNNATTFLALDLSADATTMRVARTSEFPVPGIGEYFFATIQDPDDPGTMEIVKVVEASGDDWTIERGPFLEEAATVGAYDFGPRAWAVAGGATPLVQLRVTAAALNDFLQKNAVKEQTINTPITFGESATLTGGVFEQPTINQAEIINPQELRTSRITGLDGAESTGFLFPSGARPTVNGFQVLTAEGGNFVQIPLGGLGAWNALATYKAVAENQYPPLGQVREEITDQLDTTFGVVAGADTLTFAKNLVINATAQPWNEVLGPTNEDEYARSALRIIGYDDGFGTNYEVDDAKTVAIGLEIPNHGGIKFAYRKDKTFGFAGNSAEGFVFYGSESGYMAATEFTITSDPRLKENVQPIYNPLAMLSRLRGVNFTWKKAHPEFPGLTRPGKADVGVMADEVEAVLPSAVHEMFGFKHVAYDKLIPLLIEAVNALARRVEELEKR